MTTTKTARRLSIFQRKGPGIYLTLAGVTFVLGLFFAMTVEYGAGSVLLCALALLTTVFGGMAMRAEEVRRFRRLY